LGLHFGNTVLSVPVASDLPLLISGSRPKIGQAIPYEKWFEGDLKVGMSWQMTSVLQNIGRIEFDSIL